MARDIEDGVLLLVGAGFDADKVLSWPFDKFTLFRNAAKRKELRQRLDFVNDVATAVAGSLGNKGAKGYTDDLKDILEYDL